MDLTECKFILIRQDPPFNLEYISTTYILDLIKDKVKIINNPTSIRNISEKFFSSKYKKFMPNTIFTQNLQEIKRFIKINNEIILKNFFCLYVNLIKNPSAITLELIIDRFLGS